MIASLVKRIGIFDPHEIVRWGLEKSIRDAGWKVAFSIGDLGELLQNIREIGCDLLITEGRISQKSASLKIFGSAEQSMDVLHLLKGIEALDFIVYTMHFNDAMETIEWNQERDRCLRAGAIDVIPKTKGMEALWDALHSGRKPPRTWKARSSVGSVDSMLSGIDRLTEREMQVLREFAKGNSNREIGITLNISIETVKEHVQNTLRKLAVDSRTKAAVIAARQGIV